MNTGNNNPLTENTLTIDGREIAINGERNLLELIRKADIDLPTFCYHSELSIYGACRLCLVEVEGRGIVASCSTPPEPGLKVRTSNAEIRSIRKIAVELLLAGHRQNCPTCAKSAECKLLDLARRVGLETVRFKPTLRKPARDCSSPALIRDPDKCVLCGDCVRMCSEVQGIGAIDFAHRGTRVTVGPAFDRKLNEVECVACGQCAAVCPTGALYPRSETENVWRDLHNPDKTVVAQIAPAVRVALGEMFGLPPGTASTGQIVAALKQLGFAKVYDTCFTADLTVIEEAAEFKQRLQSGERLPLFTSCCPAWVKYVELHHPELLPNVSTCRSPQQMFGALARETLPASLNVAVENLTVVSIMPCTAKKAEARRPEFATSGRADITHVLTTQELGRMIKESGINFHKITPASLDLPFGFKTGAGVIFGASGGVAEAVLRHVTSEMAHPNAPTPQFHAIRGQAGVRATEVELNGTRLRLAVVHGLGTARKLLADLRDKRVQYDFVEVMACPGGCIGGAGQPVCQDIAAGDENSIRGQRARGLFDTDRMLELHKPHENPYITRLYETLLLSPGSHKSHTLLHTTYHSRRRIHDRPWALLASVTDRSPPVTVKVCVGTSCFVRGGQKLLRELAQHVAANQLPAEVQASFCFEKCDRGPTVIIGETVLEKCTIAKAQAALKEAVEKRAAAIQKTPAT
jgi:NADH-quinone oxidoreductase subunit G